MSSKSEPIKRSTADKYVRPKTTVQDKLTPKQIKDLLDDYVEVENIKDVPIDTHIRYFLKEKGTKKFRTGGFLLNKKEADKYIILTNRKISWSVDTKKSILFRKLSTSELNEIHEDEVDELKKLIKKLYKENKNLKDKLKKYEKKKIVNNNF